MPTKETNKYTKERGEEMLKKFKDNKKKGFTLVADRCTGNPGNPGSTADSGTDRLHR